MVTFANKGLKVSGEFLFLCRANTKSSTDGWSHNPFPVFFSNMLAYKFPLPSLITFPKLFFPVPACTASQLIVHTHCSNPRIIIFYFSLYVGSFSGLSWCNLPHSLLNSSLLPAVISGRYILYCLYL